MVCGFEGVKLNSWVFAIASAFIVIAVLIFKVAIHKAKQAKYTADILNHANKVLLTQFVDGAIEDLLGLTDSEESSTSSEGVIFESQKPFVLELHDLVKDQQDSKTKQAESKLKKLKKLKKKKAEKTRSSGSSSSESESSVPPSARSKEEFYDAHESYHGLAAAAAIMQALPENGPVIKPTEEASSTEQPSATRREPSTAITKPSEPSDPQ